MARTRVPNKKIVFPYLQKCIYEIIKKIISGFVYNFKMLVYHYNSSRLKNVT